MFKSLLNKIKKNPPRDLSRFEKLSYRNINALAPGFMAIILASIVILLITGLNSVHRTKRLAQDGIATLAIVTQNEPHLYGRRNSCSKMSYEFRLDSGTVYHGDEQTLSSDRDCSLRPGDLVSIVYLPDNPSINTTKELLDKMPHSVTAWIVIFIVLLLITTVPVAIQWLVLYKHRKLFRLGIWVNGKIITIKPSRLGLESRLSRIFPIKILVSYKTKNGKSIETWVLSYQRWIFGKLKFGTAVNICYHPDNPKKAFLLESYLL